MGKVTKIGILPGNEEAIIIKSGYLGVTMATYTMIDANPITLELLHNGTALRQEDDGFGGTVDVYRAEGVHTINETDISYHLVINACGGPVYEAQIEPGRDVLTSLTADDRFDIWEMGYSISYIRR